MSQDDLLAQGPQVEVDPGIHRGEDFSLDGAHGRPLRAM